MSTAEQHKDAPHGWRLGFDLARRLSRGHTRAALLLGLLMLAAAFAEGLGFALVMPLFGSILGIEHLPGALGEALNGLVALVPESWRLEGLLALLAIAFALRSLLLIGAGGLGTHFAMRLRSDWAERLYFGYLSARFPTIAGSKQGVVTHNVANETFRASRAVTIFLDFCAKLTVAAVLFAVLAFADWQAALGITLTGGAVFYLLRRSTFRYAFSYGSKRQKLYHQISALAAESIGAVRQIKLFGLETRSGERMRGRLLAHARAETRFSIFSDLPNNLLDFVLVVFVGVLLLAMIHLFAVDLKGQFHVLVTFAAVLYRLFTTLSFIIARRMKLAATLPSLLLVDDLMRHPENREDVDAGRPLEHLDGDITFRDVAFGHGSDRPVLAALDMTLPRGRISAIVGPSGIGKSTVADLLTGLIRPDRGEIHLGSVPLREVSLRSLRRLVGYVSQEPELFDGSIRDNILAGRPDADDAAVAEAARLAHVSEFAANLPDGLDTIVGERGARLSGGQRQRIAIARVILHRPEIYIFDEATSALDHESERLIQDAIQRLSEMATVLLIAHRLSTIARSDRIYRLRAGGHAEAVNYADIAPANTEAASA